MAPLASGETVFSLSRSIIMQPILHIIHLFFRRMAKVPLESAVPNLVAH